MAKRLFDFLFSLFGLVLLSPLFFLIALIIRLDKGSAFFRQKRTGLHGKDFYIYKFRTMIPNAEKYGAQITAGYDPRITQIGHILRKFKFDELPQLINVFLGHMSLVGPRPEVPYYVKKWSEADRQVILSAKPGITDYASLYYSDEQAVLARVADPEKAYIQNVMPHKLRLYRKYVNEQNLWIDIRIILATMIKITGINIYWLSDINLGKAAGKR
ncbi:sugar transferase [Desulfobacterales bacterium HSG17]|nr:sugar transferase [Desulfobacterales bacterium HSG17]